MLIDSDTWNCNATYEFLGGKVEFLARFFIWNVFSPIDYV